MEGLIELSKSPNEATRLAAIKETFLGRPAVFVDATHTRVGNDQRNCAPARQNAGALVLLSAISFITVAFNEKETASVLANVIFLVSTVGTAFTVLLG
jgi:hypothetical protein